MSSSLITATLPSINLGKQRTEASIMFISFDLVNIRFIVLRLVSLQGVNTNKETSGLATLSHLSKLQSNVLEHSKTLYSIHCDDQSSVYDSDRLDYSAFTLGLLLLGECELLSMSVTFSKGIIERDSILRKIDKP